MAKKTPGKMGRPTKYPGKTVQMSYWVSEEHLERVTELRAVLPGVGSNSDVIEQAVIELHSRRIKQQP